MSKKYFGTDGVRGLTNAFPMTAETALRLGKAAGRYFSRRSGRHSVVIGKDTRLSGYMIESALVAGFTSVGMDVFQFGPLPTPAVSQMTRSLRADLGVMITASHNPYHDNGIKLFGPDGKKLDDATELEIETRMDRDLSENLAAPSELGRAKRIDDAQARYVEIVKSTFPKDQRLSGLRIVVDCANGAAYKVAPTVLWELGADIIPIGVEPNGFNVNQDCGSTAPSKLSEQVTKYRADLGIALDGDGDRVILCDEKGRVIDGDQILGLLARHWSHNGELAQPAIAATVMSNLGLERFLADLDIKLERTKVGDRYVAERMQATGINLGGEASGHILTPGFAPTGDGLIAALQVLRVLIEHDKPASQVFNVFEPAPQLLENVRIKKGARPLEAEGVKAKLEQAEEKLSGIGRLVVRPSGTEPLIRVMAEGDARLIREVVDEIMEAIKSAEGVS
ncbi:MAG: phosphoglucosamine mutase [Maricaulis sp.]|uniref:phosphoglucosamine mutase n=1 Tax=Maricaulis sp. TaxID=1486257 RepID=UPI001B01CABC|nr:phosphoglucosamine mutase [Maricaulis sp.]MBO6728427.1 phosphoglucosamine mutase [Maricaulis sp.]MBO6848418.1 phosphoglucosamine mutase [Maricaulis sp.]MBO6878210.1 phosphoglucosamine mutase [Maricaulis sp.]